MEEGGPFHVHGAVRLPEQEQRLRCPRCESTNTKFCYYNNYNLSQPRHFCKSCRRYWTKGGALRNVPVGGATRKPNKRPKRPDHDASSSISSSAAAAGEEAPGEQIYRGEEAAAGAEGWSLGGGDAGGLAAGLSLYSPRFG